MLWTEAVAIVLAGAGAGVLNAVVGSGTLITFPVLLSLGYPAVAANVSNNIGLIPGGLTASWGYRRELRSLGRPALRLIPVSLLGGVIGAMLLALTPVALFAQLVPALIGLSVTLILLQPLLQPRAMEAGFGASAVGFNRVALTAGILGAGIYGGYFGAAQGILLVAVLGSLTTRRLQEVNGLKNLLTLTVNVVSSLTLVMIATEHIRWDVAGLIALGSLWGGLFGSRVGRALPDRALRGVIIAVGVVAFCWVLTT